MLAIFSTPSWRLGAGLLRSEWRAGDLRLLFAALLLAVTVVTGLSAFTSRLQLMLVGEAAQMLAADRVLESPSAIDPAWQTWSQDWSQRTGGKHSRFLEFQSMLYLPEPEGTTQAAAPILVSAKAADAAYPLLGQLQYRRSLGAETIEKGGAGPQPGQVWLETRAMQQLGLQVGDAIELGNGRFVISAVLVTEPDRAAGFSGIGPRLLMHWQDIDKTGVVQLGSRTTYRYLFSGSAAALAQLDAHFKPLLADSQRWLDLKQAQPRMAAALEKAQQFLLLASSMVVILAGIAIALCAAQFAQRQMRMVAILKTLGANAAQIQGIYARALGLVGAAALLLGSALAWGLQALAIARAQGDLQVATPALTAWPFALGALVAVLSLIAFVGPALWELKKVSALTLLQQRQQSLRYFSLRNFSLTLLGLGLILAIYSRAPLQTALLLLGLMLLLAAISLPALVLLRRLRSPQLHLQGAWALARSNLQRRLLSNSVHIALFAMSGMLLLVLWGLQNQLFSQWQAQLPPRTPNYFVVNLPEASVPAAHQWLQERQLSTEGLYPMVRARLTHINGQAVRQKVSKEAADKAGINRELNLSWAEELPPTNTLLAGTWWTAQNRAHGVSVESQLAERLGLRLGDKLQFLQGAQTFEAQVTSLRKVDWDRMQPTFYMLFTPEQLWDYPKTYMSSFYLPPAQQNQINDLVQRFPQAVVLDLQAVITQIRSIMARVALALNLVLVLVLLGSVLVLASTVQNSLAERRHENAVLRALGAGRKLLQGALWLEFAAMGLAAGVLATVFAQGILLLLQRWVFDLPLALSPGLWWPAPLLGCLLIGAAGAYSARRSTQTPPMQALRAQA